MANVAEIAVQRPDAEMQAAGSVLIIDDEAAIRESLETLLDLEGYRVASAEKQPWMVFQRTS